MCSSDLDGEGENRYAERATIARRSLEELCWDESDGLYYDVNGKSNTKIRVNTFTSLMPLLLTDIDQAKLSRLMEHLLNPEEYWATYPIPSTAMNHPTFRPNTVGGNLVWRGPTWMNSNW